MRSSGGLAAVAATVAGVSGSGARAGTPRDAGLQEWAAKEEIAELRRRYAKATDLIGLNTSDAIEQGRAIYHRVFTADARIGASGQPRVSGPDAWVDIVAAALDEYQATQHLIGTQLVEIVRLPSADDGGLATATSYLQAWHAKANGELWLFIGTYHDKARYSPGIGWQIYEMTLEQVSQDRRSLSS
jgi:hypothetical protein